ncbi:MAG TPA: glycoside hydrolase family 13 protein [Candidatus Anaerofilum excrementigallinarum]|nr:glycoside hydrolase family 13 protein [Candidatus Anaerofilum excrementigallinarum]
MGVQEPRLRLWRDAHEPRYYTMEKIEPLNGSDRFTVEFSLPFTGLYFYYFDLWKDYAKVFRDSDGNGYLSREDGPAWQLTVYDQDFTTPAFLRGGVLYQIFPDRFYEGVKNKPLPYADRIYRANKTHEPYFWPNESKEGYLNMDYFGGDLEGVRQKLPYLKELGVTCIYFNPIFEAHANHRYNTADYRKIDPFLGTNEDFAKLCAEAKEAGIAIILDGVFSHTGSDSLYFNKESRYGSGGAYRDPNSPYRSWYDFSPNYACGYRSWWGFDTLPEVNENDPSYREFICGEGGVIDYWMSMGASGFRLDVADELPDDFIEDIRKAVKRHGQDKYLLGEVWEDATNKWSYGVRRTYLLGQGLDAVMNYPFRNAVLNFVKGASGQETAAQIMSICENYPAPALHTLMNFISTHDTERAITYLAGESSEGHDRYWQSGRRLNMQQYEYGIVLLRMAYAMIFTLPGVPCIYYGDEVAMQGYRDPFNRGYFDWDSKEERVRSILRKLAQLRRSSDAFAEGSLEMLEVQQDFLHYRRTGPTEVADVFINRSAHSRLCQVQGKYLEVNPMGFAIVTNDW